MLKINLLPPYIYEGAKRRNIVVLWVVALIAVIGGMIFWQTKLSAEAAEIAANTQKETPDAEAADKAASDKQKVDADNAGLKAKRDFVKNAREYNEKTYPPLFDNINGYTINRVLYNSVVPANNTVTIAAYAPSLADVGHYMLAMERNPNISTVAIGMNSIPSFPVAQGGQQAQQQGFGGGSGFPQAGGASSGGGGTRGMMMSQMRGRGGGMTSGGGGGMMMGGGPPAGLAGGGGGNAQTADNRPPGHDFTVTIGLVKPVPGGPAYGGGGGTGGGGGGAGGGFGGGMGTGGMGTGGMGTGGGAGSGSPGAGGGGRKSLAD